MPLQLHSYGSRTAHVLATMNEHLALVEALQGGGFHLCHPQTPSSRHGLGSTNVSRIWETQISLSPQFESIALILRGQC